MSRAGRLLLVLLAGLLLLGAVGAFLWSLPPIPADAQGVGFFGTAATGTRTNCTQITSPVQGQTVCLDQAANTWKFWTGATATVSSSWLQAPNTFAIATPNTANVALRIGGNIPSQSGGAALISFGPATLNAVAATDVLAAITTSGGILYNVGSASGTSLNVAEIVLDGFDMTKQGTGTPFRATPLWITRAPTIGTENYGMWVQAGGALGVGSLFEGTIRSINGYRFATDNSTTSTDMLLQNVLGGTSALQGYVQIGPAQGTSATGVPGNGAGALLSLVPSANSDQISTHINSQLIMYNRPGQARWTTTWFGNEVISDVTTSGSDAIANWRFVMGTNQAMLLNTNGFLGIGASATNTNTLTEAHIQRTGAVDRDFLRITGPITTSGNGAIFLENTSGGGANYGIGQINSASEFDIRVLPAGTYVLRITSTGNVIVPSSGLSVGSAADPGLGALAVTSGVYLNATQTLWNGPTTGTPRCTNNCGSGTTLAGTNSALRITAGTSVVSPFLILFNGTWNATPGCTGHLNTPLTTAASQVVVNMSATGALVNTRDGAGTLVNPPNGAVYSIHCLGVG